MRGEAHEILVNGPPWRMLVCVLFTDEGRVADGTLVYSNRAVLFAKIVRGRIVYQENTRTRRRLPPSTATWPKMPVRPTDLGASLSHPHG